MNPALALEIREVCFRYGHTPILDQVSLDAAAGEMLGLVGPNGAGKTTLLRIVSGTLRPQAGRVYLGGSEVAKLSSRDRARRVATVQQSPAVPTGFTALDVVLMGRNPHLGLLQWEGASDLEVARRVMERTSTDGFADRPIASLSGGERQRVFIARALAQEAPLLLLDEPTAHLDIGFQPVVLDLIQNIQREAGVSVVAAMHDLSLAAQYCRRIAVLHKGSIYALGEPNDVITTDVVSAAFGAEVSIVRHPVHGTPVVLPIGQSARRPASIGADFEG